jgi:hypothetical protein
LYYRISGSTSDFLQIVRETMGVMDTYRIEKDRSASAAALGFS